MQKEIRNVLLAGGLGFLAAYLLFKRKKQVCPNCNSQYPTGVLYTSPFVIPSAPPPPLPPPPLPPPPTPPTPPLPPLTNLNMSGMNGKFKSFYGNKY